MIKFFIDLKIPDLMVDIAKEYIIKNSDVILDIYGTINVGKLLSICGPINRFFRSPFSFEYTPLPKDYNTSLSFDDVAIDAAEKNWEKCKKQGKKIALFWSGGIDSTVALVAFMMTNSDWKNNLTIYTSRFAIQKEYPLFYDSYLKDADVKILENLQFFEHQLWCDDYMVFDGTCGDQIWGCNIISKMENIAKKHYTNLFYHEQFKKDIQILEKRKITENYINKLVDSFPVSVKTTQELYWLLTFTHKWDHVRLRHMSSVNDISVFNKMNSFFNTENFQKWSCSNFDVKMVGDFKTYKQPAKDFIYKLTKDNEYRVHKTQFESMGNSINQNCRTELYFRKIVTDEEDVSFNKINTEQHKTVLKNYKKILKKNYDNSKI